MADNKNNNWKKQPLNPGAISFHPTPQSSANNNPSPPQLVNNNNNLQHQQQQREIHLLSQRINNLEQESRNNNVIITGVPHYQSERLDVIMHEIFKILDISTQLTTEIDTMHRLNRTKPRSSILVVFKTREFRNLVLDNARWLKKHYGKLRAFDIGFPYQCINTIGIFEHLSPGNVRLYKAVRESVDDGDYKCCWVHRGKVYLKKDDASRPFRVTAMHDF